MSGLTDVWDRMPTYYNCSVYEITEGYQPKHTITSLANIHYSDRVWGENPLLINPIKLKDTNFQLRSGIKPTKEVLELNNIINGSPTLTTDITVYRGLDCQPNLDINPGFMFCSLDLCIARQYTRNTQDCYLSSGRCDPVRSKKSDHGIVIELTIPKSTHFLDLSYFDHNYNCVYSQILLSYQFPLKISRIIES